MTRKPSMFFVEKRVLTVFPYWMVVTVLIVLTILSFFPYKITGFVLRSPISVRVVRAVMHRRGLGTRQ